jgi:hypothetical protein
MSAQKVAKTTKAPRLPKMDTVLKRMLATPPQPHAEDAPKQPPKRPSSRTRGTSK